MGRGRPRKYQKEKDASEAQVLNTQRYISTTEVLIFYQISPAKKDPCQGAKAIIVLLAVRSRKV
jgi:hypothetical protein